MTTNPNRAFARAFHGEVGGTKKVHGPGLGIESLSGSPSTVIIWRRCCAVAAADGPVMIGGVVP
jgi:hypothetical protein